MAVRKATEFVVGSAGRFPLFYGDGECTLVAQREKGWPPCSREGGEAGQAEEGKKGQTIAVQQRLVGELARQRGALPGSPPRGSGGGEGAANSLATGEARRCTAAKPDGRGARRCNAGYLAGQGD